jgi:hypothetical protein
MVSLKNPTLISFLVIKEEDNTINSYDLIHYIKGD